MTASFVEAGVNILVGGNAGKNSLEQVLFLIELTKKANSVPLNYKCAYYIAFLQIGVSSLFGRIVCLALALTYGGSGLAEPIAPTIAEALKRGDLSCPEGDKIAYEACLLFQGALGIWQRVGADIRCPSPATTRPITPKLVRAAVNSPCIASIYATQVAAVVPVLINTATTVYKKAIGLAFQNPGSDPLMCIEARSGICGNHSAFAEELFKRAGFKARPVEFYYNDDVQHLSHIAVEVMIDGKWRFIDTTYGAYWVNSPSSKNFELASVEDIQAKIKAKKTHRHRR